MTVDGVDCFQLDLLHRQRQTRRLARVHSSTVEIYWRWRTRTDNNDTLWSIQRPIQHAFNIHSTTKELHFGRFCPSYRVVHSTNPRKRNVNHIGSQKNQNCAFLGIRTWYQNHRLKIFSLICEQNLRVITAS